MVLALYFHFQDHKLQPDERTYTSLIDSCWRAGEQTLALKTYRNALATGCTQSMMLYAAGIAACRRFGDLDSAMQMYGEMQK